MGKTCFVPNCKTGYRTCNDKFSIFRAPKEQEKREMWGKLIGRTDRKLRTTDYVCGKHFPETQIIKNWTKRDDNNRIICNVQLKTSRLTNDALPTIFTSDEITPKKKLGNRLKPPRKLPAKRFSPLKNQKKRNKRKRAGKCPEPVVNMRKFLDTREKVDEEKRILVENPLLYISLYFKSKNDEWRANFDEKRMILSVYLSKMANNGFVYVETQVLVNEDLSYEILFHKKEVNDLCCFLRRENPVEHLEALVMDLGDLRFCLGGPVAKFQTSDCEFASIDETGVWRHNNCAVLCSDDEIRCRFCGELVNDLQKLGGTNIILVKSIQVRNQNEMTEDLLDIFKQIKPTNINWKTKYDIHRPFFCVYSVATSKTGLAYIQKQITVAKDLSYQVHFLKRKMNAEEECFLESGNEVEDLMCVVNDVDSMKFCSGGPDQREYPITCLKIGCVDVSGVWRHNKCTGECIKPALVCSFCQCLERALKRQTKKLTAKNMAKNNDIMNLKTIYRKEPETSKKSAEYDIHPKKTQKTSKKFTDFLKIECNQKCLSNNRDCGEQNLVL